MAGGVCAAPHNSGRRGQASLLSGQQVGGVAGACGPGTGKTRLSETVVFVFRDFFWSKSLSFRNTSRSTAGWKGLCGEFAVRFRRVGVGGEVQSDSWLTAGGLRYRVPLQVCPLCVCQHFHSDADKCSPEPPHSHEASKKKKKRQQHKPPNQANNQTPRRRALGGRGAGKAVRRWREGARVRPGRGTPPDLTSDTTCDPAIPRLGFRPWKRGLEIPAPPFHSGGIHSS